MTSRSVRNARSRRCWPPSRSRLRRPPIPWRRRSSTCGSASPACWTSCGRCRCSSPRARICVPSCRPTARPSPHRPPSATRAASRSAGPRTAASRGIVGERLRVVGLDRSRTDALVRVELRDGRRLQAVLSGGDASFVVSERQRPARVVIDYVGPRRRAHPQRSRPPALRARAGAAGAEPAHVALHRHRLHARAQRHALAGGPRLRGLPAETGRVRHRALHPGARRGALAARATATPTCCGAGPGRWPSSSACSTAWASPAPSPRWGFRRRRSRSRCCRSTWESSWASSPSSPSCLLARAALRPRAARGPAWLEAAPAYAIGSLAAFWCIERAAAYAAR